MCRFSAINALKRGRYDPSMPLAFKFAPRFGLPIEDIFHPL